MGKENITK